MVSNKNNKKAKKPVDTTLGKAPSKPKEQDSDPSHLRKPIETSVSGIKDVLSLLETATNEVKNFVMYECDIMYECRLCRSIFRSLANFILHKRNFCIEKINSLDYINNNHNYQENVYMSDKKTPSKQDNRSLSKVIEKLQELERVKEGAKYVLTEDLSSESCNQIVKDMDDRETKSSSFNEIVLEKIDTNSSGVFQTIISQSDSDYNVTNLKNHKSTKLEVMEIHKILESDVPVLDPEGKICGFTSNKLHHTSIFPKSRLNCIECNQRFSSQKSLTNHVKCVHNPSRIVYVCPNCKDTFANPWCVYRHLLKVHKMTNKQVRRMREHVHNSWIRRGEETSIHGKKPPEMNQGEVNSESQWITDIEGDNDFQMCAGCGKHFERKAALHSHSQMCAKRLEICNTIKENAKKKEVEEAVEKAKLEKTVNEKSSLTGASKRKGQSIWSYQRKPKNNLEMGKGIFDSLGDEDILKIHNTEVKDSKSDDIIPNMLTPTPSPSKNENNDSLIPIINKIVQHKQEKNDVLRIAESMRDKDNNTPYIQNENFETSKVISKISEGMSPTSEYTEGDNSNKIVPVDISNIKTEQNEEDNEDLDSVYSDVENNILVINRKLEVTSSEENSRSSSNVSLKSTKSVPYTNLVKSSFEDLPRPRSDSFMKRDSSCNRESAKSSWEENVINSKVPNLGPQAKTLTRSNKILGNIKSDDFSAEENSQHDVNSFSLNKKSDNTGSKVNVMSDSKELRSKKLVIEMKADNFSSEKNSQYRLNSFPASRNSESIMSDSIDGQDNNDTLLQNNHDLLGNDVTFEMFCKKVAKVGKSRNSSSKLETNKTSPRVLRKRRKLTASEEQFKHSLNALKTPEDDDDDVIFIGETFNSKNSTFNETQLENGFAGFSHEETNKVSYSIDLSNLSYNNPLKCKQKDGPIDTLSDTFDDTCLAQKKTMKRKSQSVDKSTISKYEKHEYNFIPRAAPYMNQAKLLCIPCGSTFKSFSKLLWHMSAHFSWFRFQCSKCSFISFNKYDCMMHARKQHKLKESCAANFILPVPNWKTVLMSNEFRLLKDCNELKGKHTNEKIGIDESQDHYIEDSNEILEADAILFGESSKSSEESTGNVIEENLKRRNNKSGQIVIDIQETIKDFQKLPEPVELAMPADISEVIRTLSFDESTLPPDEAVTTFDLCGDESNDDWGLPKDSEYGETIKSDHIMITKDNDKNETNVKLKDEKVLKIRPSRIRTKAKQNADFVYYDNDINNVLKTECLKSSLQKHRTDSVLTLKTKVSGKSVPTTQKKKI